MSILKVEVKVEVRKYLDFYLNNNENESSRFFSYIYIYLIKMNKLRLHYILRFGYSFGRDEHITFCKIINVDSKTFVKKFNLKICPAFLLRSTIKNYISV